jgi:hypothetical protein
MCLSVLSASAEPPITVLLDGNIIEFDQPPIIENDRTLVPVRKIFEAMGATVDWNDETNTATGTKGYIIIVMQIGNNIITKNGQQIELDVPPQIVNDRTLVPVRAVAEGLNCTVGWDDNLQQVSIATETTYDNIPPSSYKPTYKDVYERGYDLGYSRGEAAGKKNASFDDYDKMALAMGQEGLSNEAEKDFNEGFASGWKLGYETGFKEWEASKANPDPSLSNPIEQIFNLPDLPLTVRDRDNGLEIQINEIVVKRGVDRDNKSNDKMTTIKLSCEILRIYNLTIKAPNIEVSISRHGDGEPPKGFGSSLVFTGTDYANGLGIFDGNQAKKQVGDTFEANVVFPTGFPNVSDTNQPYINEVDVYMERNHTLLR